MENIKKWPWSKTFPPLKRGVPSGKKIVPRPVTDREPFKITDENWFFVTGTLLEKHCCVNCKCDKEGCGKC